MISRSCLAARCLMRPHLFYALFIVSRISIICQMIRRLLKKICVRQVALDQWFPLTGNSNSNSNGYSSSNSNSSSNNDDNDSNSNSNSNGALGPAAPSAARRAARRGGHPPGPPAAAAACPERSLVRRPLQRVFFVFVRTSGG